MHIKSIYEDKELDAVATLKNFLTVRQEGNCQVNRNLEYYNLDMIIAVGYRVNSKLATEFRQWSTPDDYGRLGKAPWPDSDCQWYGNPERCR